jgi:hypothetical protein
MPRITTLITALWPVWLVAIAVPAHAQPTSGDPARLGPIRCYMAATRASNLEHLKAKQLCTGATGEAPARCLAEATDRVGLDELPAARLCQGARSTAPAICAKRLDDSTDLDTSSIVNYCAALHWPLVAAGTGGSPECLEAALDRTPLSDLEAARLCLGSESAAPVACYALGHAQTALSDLDLVDLCTTVVIAAPYAY